MRDHLLVTNQGPRDEGYSYCLRCGLIEPTAAPHGTVSAPHRKPYPHPGHEDCDGGLSTRGLVLGTEFITDVLLVSLRVEHPISVRPGTLSTDVALRTLSEAFSKAACQLLELEAHELQGEYRPAISAAGRDGLEAEIYLYDTLPGGAGFAARAGELGSRLFERALLLMLSCPEACDRSCYRCLRSYKNKFEHDLIDRHLGAALLRYALTDEPLTMTPERLAHSTDVLFEDLRRQGVEQVDLKRNHTLSVPVLGDVTVPILVQSGSKQLAVGLHLPLTPDEPADAGLRELKEYWPGCPVLLIDELAVQRNLPRASKEVLEQIT